MADDPKIPPAMGDDVRDLSDKEYDETYKDGDGGHPLPDHILGLLDDPDKGKEPSP
jgi:hypothetical protein